MEQYKNIDWKSALGLKKALVARNLNTRTPGLRGGERVAELQRRLLQTLQKQDVIMNSARSLGSDDTDPGTSRSSLYDEDESAPNTARSTASVSYTPRDVQGIKTIAEIRDKLNELGLSTRTPGVRGDDRVKILKQRLVDGHDGGLSSSRSDPGKFKVVSLASVLQQGATSKKAPLGYKKQSRWEENVLPPAHSPPSSPKPPSYAPPPSPPKRGNKQSAMYWSGWNESSSDEEGANVKSPAAGVDATESNIQTYEQAYAKQFKKSSSTGAIASNSPPPASEPTKGSKLHTVPEEVNNENRRNGAVPAVTHLQNSASAPSISAHMGSSWGSKNRPHARGGARRRGGGFTRGSSRGRGGRGGRGRVHKVPGNAAQPPTSARLNSRLEALSDAHGQASQEYQTKANTVRDIKEDIQQLKEQVAGVRATRDATCAERSDPACSPKLASMVDRLGKVRQELERINTHKGANFDTSLIHGNVMQRFPTRVAFEKLESMERKIDNEIDNFCTKIVKEEESSAEHGVACEKELVRAMDRAKRKLEIAEKERKQYGEVDKRAKKRLDEELERRSARPPFSGPEAVKDPWKLCQNAQFLWHVRGEDGTAQRVFVQALSRAPENVNILHAYAEFLHKQKRDHVQSAKMLQKGISLDNRHADTYALYGHILHTVMGATDEAENMILKCLEIAPTHAECLVSYALLLSSKRMDFEAAERCFKQARRHQPKNVQYIKHYARFLQKKRGNYNGAEKLYKEALDLDPCQPKLLSSYANFLMKVRGDYPRAERMYKDAMMLAPRSATAIGNFANFQQRVKGNPALAQELYLKALEMDPMHNGVKRNYSILLRDFPEQAQIEIPWWSFSFTRTKIQIPGRPTVTIPGKVTAVGKPRFNPRGCGSRIYPGVCSRGNPENGSGAKDGKGKVSW
eukprot:g8962.t1